MDKIIFFGNGPLSEAALEVLKERFEVIFHARRKEDLAEAVRLKKACKDAHGVLASFGVIIPREVLEVFEPEGILNIHPSLLPKYRGPSPIESAILSGERDLGVSVMKLAPGMDAGPIYWQEVVPKLNTWDETGVVTGGEKAEIYQALAKAGAEWISQNLADLPAPTMQDDKKATFTAKISKKMGFIDPATEEAEQILRKIVAFSGFPKVKYAVYGQNCIILAAHVVKRGGTALLLIPCAGGQNLAIDRLQPEGRRPMDAKSFINGYKK